MVYVFKHDAVLTFVGRLVRDREFSEWFVARPEQALASHGLTPADVHEVADVIQSESRHGQIAVALQPTIAFLVEMIDTARDDDPADQIAERCRRLNEEVQAAHDRLAEARARQPRPWWKFW